MPNKAKKVRVEAEEIIFHQLNRLKDSRSKAYYIPGNHDWNRGKKDGLSHLLNEEKFIEKIESVFDEHENIIYAAGHEHNLQYYDRNNRHYIVSGSDGKTSNVKQLKLPGFS